MAGNTVRIVAANISAFARAPIAAETDGRAAGQRGYVPVKTRSATASTKGKA
jgi:hypothetical protein